MTLTVGRTVDPHSLVVTVRMEDAEIKTALGHADPDDLGFKIFLEPVASMPKADYIRLVADLVERAEQAAALNVAAAPGPENK